MNYYVDASNTSHGKGTKDDPFRTVSAAAEVLMPGDSVFIAEGVYRERVSPKRGGLSEKKRISYIGPKSKKAIITGTERVSFWTDTTDGAWSADVTDVLEKDFNPFAEAIGGDWFDSFGQTLHLGMLFINGEECTELDGQQLNECIRETPEKLCFSARVSDGRTVITACFGKYNPNSALTEISVRPCCFFPLQEGINYITVKNLTLEKAASQWAPPTAFQGGIIGTNFSIGWVIENCAITYSRCCGISLGKKRESDDNSWSRGSGKGGAQLYSEIIFRSCANEWQKNKVGSHIVQNNEISHCGQAGIIGCMGGAFSLIRNNIIHHINSPAQFGGAEIAAIKLHAAIDTVFESNVIFASERGLWLDWEAQGARVSSNVFFMNNLTDMYIEMCHGPLCVDGNIFLSAKNLINVSQGTAFINNLFCGELELRRDTDRFSMYHFPHSTAVAGEMFIFGGDDRLINNVFTGLFSASGTSVYNTYPPAKETTIALSELPSQDANIRLPVYIRNNVYCENTKAYIKEEHPVKLDKSPKISVTCKDKKYTVCIIISELLRDVYFEGVLTEELGKAFEPQCGFSDFGSETMLPEKYFSGEHRERLSHPGPLCHDKWLEFFTE